MTEFRTSNGGVYELQLNFSAEHRGLSIHVNPPVDLIQEKLKAIGYEIVCGNPGKKREPILLRGESPAISLEVTPSVRVRISVTHLQNILRGIGGTPAFDIYTRSRKSKWS